MLPDGSLMPQAMYELAWQYPLPTLLALSHYAALVSYHLHFHCIQLSFPFLALLLYIAFVSLACTFTVHGFYFPSLHLYSV